MKNEKLAEKKRKGLSTPKPRKKRGFWGSMFSGDIAAMSKHRKALEDALKY